MTCRSNSLAWHVCHNYVQSGDEQVSISCFVQARSEPGVIDVRPVRVSIDAGTQRTSNLQSRAKSRKARFVQKILKCESAQTTPTTGNASVESVTTYVCQICRSFFGSQSGLRNHQTQHNPNAESGYFCENCAIRFNSQASLYRHKRLVHSDGKKYIHNCKYCHKGYFNKTDLIEHLYKHTNIPGFSCDECDQRFRSKLMFRRHKRDWHGAAPKGTASAVPHFGNLFPS